jgi:cardiolipin synthase (CMP-forming)
VDALGRKSQTMTLANKITVLRIIAVPLFVIALIEHHLRLAQWIFMLSIATDAMDGAIARIRGERTPLGTFLDPLADKMLLGFAFIAFTYLRLIPIWVFITVLSRDLILVLGWTVIYILTGNSKIQPRPLGKATTVLQMGVILTRLFQMPEVLYHWTLHVMIAVTIISACDYIWMGNQRLGALE